MGAAGETRKSTEGRQVLLSKKSLKVTDRRMFTAEGELREEYRHLEDAKQRADPSPAQPSPAAPGPTAPSPAAPGPSTPSPAASGPSTPLGAPPAEPAPAGGAADAPRFSDLIGLLAEPASLYLRESRGGSPQEAAESLELARLYIDLLSLLQQKTQGNLDAREQAMLDDVVYQLRSAYVGLRR